MNSDSCYLAEHAGAVAAPTAALKQAINQTKAEAMDSKVTYIDSSAHKQNNKCRLRTCKV